LGVCEAGGVTSAESDEDVCVIGLAGTLHCRLVRLEERSVAGWGIAKGTEAVTRPITAVVLETCSSGWAEGMVRNQTDISTTPTPWTRRVVHVKLHQDTVLAVVPAWLAWTCKVGEVGDRRVNGAVAGVRRATGDYFAAYEKLGGTIPTLVVEHDCVGFGASHQHDGQCDSDGSEHCYSGKFGGVEKKGTCTIE